MQCAAQVSQEAEDAYAALRKVVAAREEVLRGKTILFAGALRGKGAQSPYLATCGVVRFGNRYEKWIRYIVEPRYSANGLSDLTLDDILSLARQNAQPTLFIHSKSRTIAYAPHEKIKGLWRGTLFASSDASTVRTGALNCTILWGERWLSERLATMQLWEWGVSEGEQRFVVGEANTDGTRLTVFTNEDTIPVRIVAKRKGVVRFEASVDTFESIGEGFLAPVKGTVRYAYGRPGGVILTAYIRYEPPAPVKEQEDLLSVLPNEITKANGAALVVDELTDAQLELGNPQILEHHRRTVLRNRRQRPSSNGLVPSFVWTLGGILALIVTLVAICHLKKRRQRLNDG